MAKATSDKVVTDAGKLATVWSNNPDFTLRNVTLQQVQTMVAELQSDETTIATRRTELEGLVKRRDDRAKALNEINTRGKSGVRAFFGPDSPEYEQVGGVRASEKKAPTRKPATTK